MPLNYRNRSHFQVSDPKLAEALDDIAGYSEKIMQNTNVTASGDVKAPPAVDFLTVSAAQGIFDVAISDNKTSVSRGINYFVEYSTLPSFVSPHVIDLGSSRNWRGILGNQTFYFRAYSSYPTSPRSEPVYFGSKNNPTAVVGGGSIIGPVPLASNGSGTSKGGDGADGGFGNTPFRGERYQI